MKSIRFIIFIIVLAQFCCTSLWFATNAVLGELLLDFQLNENALEHLTSAVQFGFIIGTLLFALFSIADRFSPSKVFFICALLGACINAITILESNNFFSLLLIRFSSGFFLAGIYPVGMKIASDYSDKGLGKALGFLVGALVLGTAFPHLLNGLFVQISWHAVIVTTSLIALFGGLLILLFVPNGPYRKRNNKPAFKTGILIFQNPKLRTAALGYFGHMWELYSFWAFVPIILTTYFRLHKSISPNISLYSFIIIGVGGLACVIGGFLSSKYGEKRIARIALLLSGICCLLSPFLFHIDSSLIFIGFLVFWGMVVVADSPLFSTLVAQNTPAEYRATSLTLVNSIGFAITIISIQCISLASNYLDPKFLYLILAIGPIVGVLALYRKKSLS
ncbi:putative MFS family arabinose efflux permease [Gillisia mitskevichiae]|uniref:Putative MFS family arabinose efflux permease n=1 Tax=Gillisia mitskevichiae TaxID=270921 RepID=A0A495NWE8_9FLAO|nr:MFS transporter [Gillisia mitskevichiae]RKS42734.1 putative MFS family arabinose efflux permease [Gillisia mitskevichiae]